MLNPVTALWPLSGQTMHNATHQGRGTRGKSRDGAIAKAVRTVFEKLEERRLLSAGQLDTTFAGSGKVLTDFSNGQDDGFAIAPLPDGGVAVAGSFSNALGIARYDSGGGLLWTNRVPIGSLSVANAMVFEGGKLVVA